MRHFAIYAHPWPARTPGQRARFMPTPREELTPVDPSHRRITPKVLPALDRKLAAAAKSPSKSRRSESSADEPPTKKRKTETGSKATMSAEAKETLAGSGRTRSGRHSVPSTRAQESSVKKPIGRPRSTTPPPRMSTTVPRSISKMESVSAPVEPRRFFQRGKCPPPWSRPTKSTVVLYQPRGESCLSCLNDIILT
jgi:histone-lysine N-methyltransferase SUV420H